MGAAAVGAAAVGDAVVGGAVICGPVICGLWQARRGAGWGRRRACAPRADAALGAQGLAHRQSRRKSMARAIARRAAVAAVRRACGARFAGGVRLPVGGMDRVAAARARSDKIVRLTFGPSFGSRAGAVVCGVVGRRDACPFGALSMPWPMPAEQGASDAGAKGFGSGKRMEGCQSGFTAVVWSNTHNKECEWSLH